MKNHKTIKTGHSLPTRHKLRIAGRLARSAAKLAIADIRKIRKLLKNGVLQKDIANSYNVHVGTINKINMGHTWYWVKK